MAKYLITNKRSNCNAKTKYKKENQAILKAVKKNLTSKMN